MTEEPGQTHLTLDKLSTFGTQYVGYTILYIQFWFNTMHIGCSVNSFRHIHIVLSVHKCLVNVMCLVFEMCLVYIWFGVCKCTGIYNVSGLQYTRWVLGITLYNVSDDIHHVPVIIQSKQGLSIQFLSYTFQDFQ